MSQFDLDLDPPAALHEQDNILSHMILVWGFSDIEWRFPLDDGVETTDLLTVKRAKEMLREESKKPRSKVLYPDHAVKNTTEKETSFGHLQEDEEQELHKENEHDFWVAGGATIPVDAMILLDMDHHEHDSDGHDDEVTGAGQDDAAGHEESDHAEPFSALPDATLMRTVGYRARVCLKPLEAVVQPADAIERLKDKIDKLRKVDGFWVWDRSVLGVAATEWYRHAGLADLGSYLVSTSSNAAPSTSCQSEGCQGAQQEPGDSRFLGPSYFPAETGDKLPGRFIEILCAVEANRLATDAWALRRNHRAAEDLEDSVELEAQYVDALGKLLFFVRAKHAGTLSQKQFCLAAVIRCLFRENHGHFGNMVIPVMWKFQKSKSMPLARFVPRLLNVLSTDEILDDILLPLARVNIALHVGLGSAKLSDFLLEREQSSSSSPSCSPSSGNCDGPRTLYNADKEHEQALFDVFEECCSVVFYSAGHYALLSLASAGALGRGHPGLQTCSQRISFLESWIARLTELMFSYLLSVPVDGDLARSLLATERGRLCLETCQYWLVEKTSRCCNFGLGRGGLKNMIKSGRVCFPSIQIYGIPRRPRLVQHLQRGQLLCAVGVSGEVVSSAQHVLYHRVKTWRTQVERDILTRQDALDRNSFLGRRRHEEALFLHFLWANLWPEVGK